MSPKGKMESLSRFNFILFKQTKNYSFSPIVSHIFVALKCMEYLSGPGAVAALSIHIFSTEITFPTRDHTMQYFIFQNNFFPRDVTGFSAENFHLISVSTPKIFLCIFHEKILLFMIFITTITFTKQYKISWHKQVKLL